MYTRLFESIVDSSLFSESADHCKVWVYLLAKADLEGYVYASVSGIARICVMTIERVEAVLATFLAPDPHSSDLTRNPQNEGRRIEAVPGGWRVINLPYYRKLYDSGMRREQVREATRRYRDAKKTGTKAAKKKAPAPAPAEPSGPAEPPLTPAHQRTWQGLGPASTAVARFLDARLTKRDAALRLPDKLGDFAPALNKLMVKKDADRVRVAIEWALQDKWFHDKISDIGSLISQFTKIINGSADAWRECNGDVRFLDEQ